jgi:hypothetical protein
MPFRPGIVAFLLLAALTANAAEIKGRITQAVGGEALGRVEVTVIETKASATTSPAGEFDIPRLSTGSYTLRLNAVGFRMLTVPFTLAAANEVKEFSLSLVPDNFHHTDKVEVHGDIFQGSDSPATNEMNLQSSEIREASTVFADDPFRAVQALPGVSAEGNNEFFAEFSVMGAPFSTVSIYIDDVLVPSPFHEIGNFAQGASLGVLSSEVVEEMKLMPAAYPEKFGDAAGAALDVRTREGSRSGPHFRFSTGIAASEILAEGGLRKSSKGSWLITARKSYINYLVNKVQDDAPDVGFYDGGVKLNYDLTARQSLNFYATGGRTDSTDSSAADPNIFASGRSDFTLARTGWRWSATPHLLLDARVAYMREPGTLRNPNHQFLATSDYREWVGSGGLTWSWAKDDILEAGLTTRHINDSESQTFYDTSGALQSWTPDNGTALRESGYVQQATSLWKGRLHVLGGVRWDSQRQLDLHPFSPQISLSLRATASTEFQVAAGRYRQFPALEEWSNFCLTPASLPEKSDQYSATVEQRIGENTRLRLQVFDRENSFSLGEVPGQTIQSLSGPCGHDVVPIPNSTFERSYSRGAQFVLQRRSANRLSGWIGYTLATSQQRQYPVVAISYPCPPICFVYPQNYSPTLEDQRHSLNIFSTYRLRPSVNVSGKFLFGSGFPISTGVFQQVGTVDVYEGLSTLRIGYQRLDIRVDKDWAFKRWKLTLYAEMLNLTNHYNARYVYSSVIQDGHAQVQTLQGLPITPTAGLVFQF